MRFAKRTAWQPDLSEWAEALEEHSRVTPMLDLTRSNPIRCGLGPLSSATLAPLASPEAFQYVPEPFGMRRARAAVVAYYRDHGQSVPAEQVCLTTSTSEAYSFVFRLLCDAGDEVLIAVPSYPLLNLLAQLHDVVLREYAVLCEPGAPAGGDARWSLDLHGLRSAITARTRAVVVVHPNNPTGHYLSMAERDALVTLCVERELALIVDEVFLDYALEGRTDGRGSFAGEPGCLCFVLSGISKICALPQMKASWLVASGPEREVHEAMRRLEIIADTFLSVNASTQHALPYWLEGRAVVQAAILDRIRANLGSLDDRLKGSMGSRYGVEGGWTAVLRVPRFVRDEAFAVAALRAGVAVQPGTLYGLPEGRCVLSLLTEPPVWAEGLARLPF